MDLAQCIATRPQFHGVSYMVTFLSIRLTRSVLKLRLNWIYRAARYSGNALRLFLNLLDWDLTRSFDYLAYNLSCGLPQNLQTNVGILRLLRHGSCFWKVSQFINHPTIWRYSLVMRAPLREPRRTNGTRSETFKEKGLRGDGRKVYEKRWRKKEFITFKNENS